MSETVWPITEDQFLSVVESPQAKPSTLRGRFFTVDEIDDLPDIEPLIENTIPLGSVSLLAGQFMTAKSFVAMSMAFSVSTGTPWYGRETKQKKALYVAAEGRFGLKSRLRAWEAHNETALGADFLFYDQAVQLGNRDQVQALAQEIRDREIGFLVIDTLKKSTSELNENDNSEMSRAVQALYELQEATGDGSVLVVHHTGKDGKTIRGASALEADVDVVYLATSESDLFKIERKKNKEGPVSDQRFFKLVEVPGHDTPALDCTEKTDTTKNGEKVLEALSVLCRNGLGVKQADLKRESGLPAGTFEGVKHRLQKSGLVHIEGEGKETRFYLPENKPF